MVTYWVLWHLSTTEYVALARLFLNYGTTESILTNLNIKLFFCVSQNIIIFYERSHNFYFLLKVETSILQETYVCPSNQIKKKKFDSYSIFKDIRGYLWVRVGVPSSYSFNPLVTVERWVQHYIKNLLY